VVQLAWDTHRLIRLRDWSLRDKGRGRHVGRAIRREVGRRRAASPTALSPSVTASAARDGAPTESRGWAPARRRSNAPSPIVAIFGGFRCPGPAELEHRRLAVARALLAGEDKREGFDAASSKLVTSLRPEPCALRSDRPTHPGSTFAARCFGTLVTFDPWTVTLADDWWLMTDHRRDIRRSAISHQPSRRTNTPKHRKSETIFARNRARKRTDLWTRDG